MHLDFKYTFAAVNALADHDYTKNETYNINIINIPNGKMELINSHIPRTLQEKSNSQKVQKDIPQAQKTVSADIEILKKLDLEHGHKFDLENNSSHHSVQQNSQAWFNLRKFKITGSRMPALLGFYGKSKFSLYWRVVKEGLDENDISANKIVNFQRGHAYILES